MQLLQMNPLNVWCIKKFHLFLYFLKSFFCKINNKFTFILNFFTVVSLTFLSMFVCITLKHLATRFRINKYEVICWSFELYSKLLVAQTTKSANWNEDSFSFIKLFYVFFFVTEVYLQSDNVKHWFS